MSLKLNSVSYDQLQTTTLFRDFIKGDGKLKLFLDTFPTDAKSLAEKAAALNFKGDREKLAELLLDFNQKYGAGEKAKSQINRLRKKESITVTTGQQTTIFGGPGYILYKALSVIDLALKLEQETGKPVIPVFWIADEDHDLDEISSVNIPAGKSSEKIGVDFDHIPPHASAAAELHAGIAESLEKLFSIMPETDFSGDVRQLLEKHYQPGKTYAAAFAGLMLALFEEHGLILAGSNHPAIKKTYSGIFRKAVSDADQIENVIRSQSDKLAEVYHQQAMPVSSQLFLHDEKKGRVKLNRENEKWSNDSGKVFTNQELQNLAEKDPSKFSPNVFLRPVLQQAMLPNLVYLGGPAEIAYHAQLKPLFEHFEVLFPVLMPRLSMSLIEPPIGRIIHDLPFQYPDYSKRIEDLESEFMEQQSDSDSRDVFRDLKSEMETLLDGKLQFLVDQDASLKGAIKSASSRIGKEVDKLEQKHQRSLKQNEKVQLQRISKIAANLFPEGNPQERFFGWIYYLNKYGPELIRSLAEETGKKSFEVYYTHQLVSL